MNIFEELHHDLPREGPGDRASTRRALALLSELPPAPRILDIGCGPGTQTGELLAVRRAQVVALDVRFRFLTQTRQLITRVPTVADLSVVQASMFQLPFADGSFDAIWSEGAVYIMGFENGLRTWRRLLKSRGYLAVSEVSWLSQLLLLKPSSSGETTTPPCVP